MTQMCDGKRCRKCSNDEYCGCLMLWPDEIDRNTDRYYYEDEIEIKQSIKIKKPLVDLEDFNL